MPHSSTFKKQVKLENVQFSGNASSKSQQNKDSNNSEAKYVTVDVKRTWTVKSFKQLRKVQIMNVGSELIDLHEDGWTKWLANEIFLPFIEEKVEFT